MRELMSNEVQRSHVVAENHVVAVESGACIRREKVADVEMKHPLVAPTEPVAVDLNKHVGVYERASVRMEVLNNGEGPRLRTEILGHLAALVPDPVEEYPLVPVNDDRYLLRPPGTDTWMPVTFYSLPTGEEYVHFGARATPKRVEA